MPTIRVDSYDQSGNVAHIDIKPVDGFAFFNMHTEDSREASSLTLTISVTELEELAQVAMSAAAMIRKGDY